MDDAPVELLEVLNSTTSPLSVGELEGRLEIPRRTLQRHLRQLVERGAVRRIGAGPGTRYVVAEAGMGLTRTRRTAVLNHLATAPNLREPVTYDAGFLESYRPNSTYYLPAALRDRLHTLGEPASTMPAGTYSRHILNRLLIDLSWNSSRLEGNTYSLLETEELLLQGEAAEGKSATETQMLLNHKAAIEFLVEAEDELDLSPLLVRNLHAMLSENLLADPASCGRLRRIPVQISGSSYVPLADPHRVARHFEHILEVARQTVDPFEASFFVLVHLPYLQPFVDVNKRVSRLAANVPFLLHSLYPISFLDTDRDAYLNAMLAIYELNEPGLLVDLFADAYERSAKKYAVVRESLGEPDEFRLHHRSAIKAAVAAIVRGGVTPKTLDSALAEYEVTGLSSAERARFDQVVREELGALHEGNFARFRLRPSEFERWSRARAADDQ